jgi:predicted PurR-regulated permease PerM
MQTRSSARERMSNDARINRSARLLMYGAAFVVLVAGARAAEPILVPFLLSVMLAIICVPPLNWLQRLGLPTWAAVLIIVVGLLAVISFTGTLVGTSLIDFTTSLPAYQARLQIEMADLVAWLAAHGFEISNELLLDYFDPGALLRVAARIFSGVGDVLGKIALILITTFFILLEVSGFRAKIRAAFVDPETQFVRLERITDDVKRYLAIKTLISLITGVAITVWLMVMGVDYAFLWGLLAFLLNYIPSIGSFIAAIPAVLLAFLQLGFGGALGTAVGFLVVNTIMGNLVEPRVMGQEMGLSTLVVFLSLVFWGWVLGPVGMLLSVPLTMILKIILEGSEETRWLAVLLCPKPSGGTAEPPS